MGYTSGVDDVAEAIADPVRRAVLELLRAGPQPAGHIASVIGGRFAISRPAVSRHLRVLRECGLVRDTLDGRRRLYALDPARLLELSGWLGQFFAWQQRMDALETEVYRTRRDRRRETSFGEEHTA
jgi:DNA-binding transcriptional ArsR family regulator